MNCDIENGIRFEDFNGKHYLQIHGTAMGKRMAPLYANLFLAKFDNNALTHARHKRHIWWRYIDDIFMIWTHHVTGERQHVNNFKPNLNGIHPTIK